MAGPYPNVLSLIGNTPLLRIRADNPATNAEIWAKLESFNPGGSVKDRVALSMVEQAERDGLLKPGGTIVEPTSGNTGIGLALVGAAKRYHVVLCMPETMTVERRMLMLALGAELVLTPGEKGILGSWDEAARIEKTRPDCFMPLQFENPANPEAHRRSTGPELVRDMGRVPDAFVAGVGTGGTITGVGEYLRTQRPDVHIVAVEPAASAILSGGEPGRHNIPGIGAGFAPGVLNMKIFDEVIAVTDDDALHTMQKLARMEGLFMGISSGAALWAARKVAKRIGRGKQVVVVFPDGGGRYLSKVAPTET